MPAFFLSLLACALATLAGRDAVRVARLAAALGSGAGLLLACWLAVAAALGAAAWLGAGVAQGLHGDAKLMLAAFALAVGGLELLLLAPGRAPLEPTRSFGAIALVLTASQLTGSGGFLIFALAGAAGMPVLAAAGGVLGAGAMLTMAWLAGADWERRLPLRAMARAGGVAMVLAAVATGLSARGIMG